MASETAGSGQEVQEFSDHGGSGPWQPDCDTDAIGHVVAARDVAYISWLSCEQPDQTAVWALEDVNNQNNIYLGILAVHASKNYSFLAMILQLIIINSKSKKIIY